MPIDLTLYERTIDLDCSSVIAGKFREEIDCDDKHIRGTPLLNLWVDDNDL